MVEKMLEKMLKEMLKKMPEKMLEKVLKKMLEKMLKSVHFFKFMKQLSGSVWWLGMAWFGGPLMHSLGGCHHTLVLPLRPRALDGSG